MLADYARDGARRWVRGRRERCCSSRAGCLVGDAGVLLTRVAVPQAGRGAQLRDRRRGDERPAAAGALRRVARGRRRCVRAPATRARWDIVGPVCESARFPRARPRCSRSRDGDLLAVARRRRVRDGDELQLQLAAARLRGDRRRRRACISCAAARRVDELFARESTAAVKSRVARARNSRANARSDAVCEFATVAILTRRNRRRNLANRRNVATMQAAGGNGFVKRLQFKSAIDRLQRRLRRSRSTITVTATQTGETTDDG